MSEEQEHSEPETEIDDLDVDEDAAEDVRGGRRGEPPPVEPIPIPYPN